VPELREHLDAYVGPDSTALVFTGQRGGVLRRGNFRRASHWSDPVAAIGRPGLHFHDLRHEAISRFCEMGLTLPEVALISGHRDPRMLFRYTHLKAEDVAKRISHLSSQ